MPLFEKITYYKTQITVDYAPFVDKLDAKQIVHVQSEGAVRTAPLIRELTSPTDIHESDMNPAWILKASHGCAWNLDLSGATVSEARRCLQEWNTHYRSAEEPHYSFLRPRFFIEEKITDTSPVYGERATPGKAGVYMIRCVKGKPICISYKWGTQQNTYDPTWKLMKKPELEEPLPPPAQLTEMLRIAEKLARPFELARIDLYIGRDSQRPTEGIYFSEYTFTPAGGNMFFPYPLEKQLGRLW